MQEPHAEGPWRDHMAQALHGIAEPWRTPVVLHFLKGMRQKDLACRLDVSQQMVSRRIERGLTLLRGRLERQDCQV